MLWITILEQRQASVWSASSDRLYRPKTSQRVLKHTKQVTWVQLLPIICVTIRCRRISPCPVQRCLSMSFFLLVALSHSAHSNFFRIRRSPHSTTCLLHSVSFKIIILNIGPRRPSFLRVILKWNIIHKCFLPV